MCHSSQRLVRRFLVCSVLRSLAVYYFNCHGIVEDHFMYITFFRALVCYTTSCMLRSSFSIKSLVRSLHVYPVLQSIGGLYHFMYVFSFKALVGQTTSCIFLSLKNKWCRPLHVSFFHQRIGGLNHLCKFLSLKHLWVRPLLVYFFL